ncbi:DUF2243 domain-containing protein [Falsiroseomonas sp. E2-1-a20]|uniref:DUF2243 domain-containing protein n=1 Tax=Falsiroseomonas sp. E2-1-a20 TaxID=3239300 RepID=UPI003F3A3644
MESDANRLKLPALLIGFALGGFFDGILLHQILQWHHLLSGVVDPGRLRFHMLWDGMFHAAHYLLAVIGLWLLLVRRRDAAVAGAVLAGGALIGFGAWHLLDAVLNHWILGLHRIRQDVADPLPWDLLFFGLGGVAVALGTWVGGQQGGGRGGGAGRVLALGLAGAVIFAAPVAALPPREPDVAAQLVAGGLLPAFCAAWTRTAAR